MKIQTTDNVYQGKKFSNLLKIPEKVEKAKENSSITKT
jgi:hypothetical protein